MTRTVNTQIVVGYLGADPILRALPSGNAVTNISVGTSEEWVDKNTGEVKSITDWHSVSLYRRDAENAAAYLKKGSLVFVQGPSRTRKYQDKNTGEDRYSRTIEAKVINYLDRVNNDARPPTEEVLAHQPSSSDSDDQTNHDAWLAEYDSVDVTDRGRRA